MKRALMMAVPKGRILGKLIPLFEQAGLDVTPLCDADRMLIKRGRDITYLLLKPDDVPTYVEFGAADVGVCGRDILMEQGYDLLEPLDLHIGRCRMVMASLPGPLPSSLRVATKFPRLTARYLASQGVPAEIIQVSGSVELAPLVGLSDVIVDLVETGSTLRENGLIEREVLYEISSVLVVNRASYKLRRDEVEALCHQLQPYTFSRRPTY